MYASIVIDYGKVRNKRHRKEFVDLNGAKHARLVCGSVRRMALYIIPPSSSTCGYCYWLWHITLAV
jgi:hypothetical protein